MENFTNECPNKCLFKFLEIYMFVGNCYHKAFHIQWGAYKLFLGLRNSFQKRADKSYVKYKATVAVMDKIDEADDKRNKPRKDAEFIVSIFNRN